MINRNKMLVSYKDSNRAMKNFIRAQEKKLLTKIHNNRESIAPINTDNGFISFHALEQIHLLSMIQQEHSDALQSIMDEEGFDGQCGGVWYQYTDQDCAIFWTEMLDAAFQSLTNDLESEPSSVLEWFTTQAFEKVCEGINLDPVGIWETLPIVIREKHAVLHPDNEKIVVGLEKFALANN